VPTGIVKSYFEERGFGFLKPNGGGADVFAHAKAILGASMLIPGQMVEFEITLDERSGKYRAADIRIV
jgi:CspA family cold shock protein